jgi:hypothetical protein
MTTETETEKKKKEKPEVDQRKTMIFAIALTLLLAIRVNANECDDVNCQYDADVGGGMTRCNRPELCMAASASNPDGSST